MTRVHAERHEFIRRVLQVEYHRNGVGGEGFHAVLFDDCEGHRLLALVFPAPGHVAVIEPQRAAAGILGLGDNTWRGDYFEPELRRAIDETA